MTHLLTGSEDGYIRDYNVFTALNGKTFLSAPQRHHAGVVEGLMKAGHLYCWWDNPGLKKSNGITSAADDDAGNAPVYSLAMHSDALWALSGSDVRLLQFFIFDYRFMYLSSVRTY
jgi:transcriptional activator SPT8